MLLAQTRSDAGWIVYLCLLVVDDFQGFNSSDQVLQCHEIPVEWSDSCDVNDGRQEVPETQVEVLEPGIGLELLAAEQPGSLLKRFGVTIVRP